MNNRLLTLGGALLLAAGCMLLILQLTPLLLAPQAATATLVVHARNAGARLAPEDGVVLVYAADSPDDLLARGELGQSFSLAPGQYDVQVIYSRTADQQSLWLRQLVLTAGERRQEQLEFAAGEILLEASVGSDGAESGEVVVYYFENGNHDEILSSGPAGRPVLLGAGEYDLRVVWSVNSREKDVRWQRGIQVKVGLQTSLQVPFDRGVLLLKAQNGATPLVPGEVGLTVYLAGDAQREVVDTGLAGHPLGLASGHYDIKATYRASLDRPERWLRDLEIADGEVVDHTVTFSSGSVMVEAALQGGENLDPYDSYVYYYRKDEHEQAVGYTPNGSTAILEQGRYDVRVHYFRSHDQPDIWLRDLSVRDETTVTRRVHFPSGKLLVRAYDTAGEELIGDTIFIYVHAAGHADRHLVRIRSGEYATLTEGIYDVHAVDTRGGETLSRLSGVQIHAGLITHETLAVPDR